MSPAERRGVLFRRCVVPSYHPLNQLTDFRRGVLSDSNSDGVPDTVTTASRSQAWDFDALGNWDSVTTDGSAQTRSHNKQNQIPSISGQTTPAYDGNGNMTTDEIGKTLVYDAWNRLVAYKDGSTTLVSYQYDAPNRRVVENPGTAVDLYFSSSWQVLEERQSGQAKAQHVWSPVYVDALVLRDRDTNGQSGDGLEERLFVQQDGNWNVSAIISMAGIVLERCVEDPYGQVAVLAPDWTSRASALYTWLYMHQGGRLTTLTGLYHFRNRDYSSTLGRWVQRDPTEYLSDTKNLYGYVRNRPLNATDPLGLKEGCKCLWDVHVWGKAFFLLFGDIGNSNLKTCKHEVTAWRLNGPTPLKQKASTTCYDFETTGSIGLGLGHLEASQLFEKIEAPCDSFINKGDDVSISWGGVQISVWRLPLGANVVRYKAGSYLNEPGNIWSLYGINAAIGGIWKGKVIQVEVTA